MQTSTKKHPSMRDFWCKVTNYGRKPCALAHDHRRCNGPLDAHHYVPKRKLISDAAKTDPRNGVPLCRRHHDLVERHMVTCPRPRDLDWFLIDHGVNERYGQTFRPVHT